MEKKKVIELSEEDQTYLLYLIDQSLKYGGIQSSYAANRILALLNISEKPPEEKKNTKIYDVEKA